MSEVYLSRVGVALGRPPVQERGATAEYLLHQAVADLFGNRGDRGYVWRQLAADARGADVLILSTTAPDPTAGDRMPSHRRVRSVVSRPFRPDLRAGQQLDFELRVNATRVVSTPAEPADIMDVEAPKAHKRRFDVWDVVFATGPAPTVSMVDVYATWLRAQLESVARIDEMAVTERGMVRVRRSLTHPAMPIVATNLVGSLTVREPDALVARMAAGIGRSRAFGCGLLCLARLGSRPRRQLVSGGAAATDGRAVATSAGV